MALSDWIFKDINGNDLTAALRDDMVAEGSKSLGIEVGDIEAGVIVHKQTIADKPISGAVKTYFGAIDSTYTYYGAVFKYQDYQNFVFVQVAYDGYLVIGEYTNGERMSWIEEGFGATIESGKWYILEAILNDEDDEVSVRVKDANENTIDERTYQNIISSEWKGKGGGIGLFISSIRNGWYIRYDLTKIYYP